MYQNKVSTVHDLYNAKMMLYPSLKCISDKKQDPYTYLKCYGFILLHVVDQFSQHHLLKRLSFFHCIFLPPLSKIRCP